MFNLLFRMSTAISLVVLVNATLTGCGGGASTSLPSGRSISQLPTTPETTSGPAKVPSSIAQQAVGGNAYSEAVLADRPLAYYQLNDSSSTLSDSGPNRITGVYGPSVTHHVAALTTGGSSATGFPGGTSYNPNGFAYTSQTGVLQPSTLTVEAWFKLNAASPANSLVPIAVYGPKGTSYGLWLQGLGGNVDRLFYMQTDAPHGNRLFLFGSEQLAVGVIYHIVAVFNGTNVTTYINGLVDQTVGFPGVVDYAPGVYEGLQIGGDKQTSGGTASFPGTIAQVAIYGYAMSAQTIVSHFLIGQLLPMISEVATSADAFVDSIGINTHFEDTQSLYSTQFSLVKNLLAASGIRHFRNIMAFGPGSTFNSEMQQLAAVNIHGSYVTLPTYTQSQIESFPSLVHPSLEQIEAPNEADDQEGNPNWEAGCIAFQKALYSWVKGYPPTAAYPVLGPGLAYALNFKRIGDLSGYMDIGNFHDYMGNYNPGYVGGPFGGMKAMISDERGTSGTKPIMSTETGYGTVTGGTSPTDIDFRADLRYMTRAFFEQFNAGVSRSYSYEFIDEPTAGGFATFGILNPNLSPKPAYTGIKSLIEALQDPGPRFTTSSLTYSLSGLSTVHHLVMQKRNGTFVLALWLELPGWNVLGGGDIIVPNQSVSLTTANNFSSAALSAMDENGNFSTSALPWTNKHTTITVSDKVSLVTLTP